MKKYNGCVIAAVIGGLIAGLPYYIDMVIPMAWFIWAPASVLGLSIIFLALIRLLQLKKSVAIDSISPGFKVLMLGTALLSGALCTVILCWPLLRTLPIEYTIIVCISLAITDIIIFYIFRILIYSKSTINK